MKRFAKPIVAALAGASLLALPLAATAQQHHSGGGFHGGAAFHGGGFRAGGFHGGYGGWRGGGYPFVGGLGLGLALGAYPWYYDYGPAYGYYPDYAYDAPPPAAAVQPAPSACGSWSWDAGANRYNWVPC